MKRFLGCLPVPFLAMVSWGLVFAWARWVNGASAREAAGAAMGLFLWLTVGLAVVLVVVFGIGVTVFNQRVNARTYQRQRAALPTERAGSARTVREAAARGVRGTFIVNHRTMQGFAFVWWTAADVTAEAAAEGIDVESGKTVWDTLHESDIGEMALKDTFTPWCTQRHLDAERGDAVLICSADGVFRVRRWAGLQREFPGVPLVYTDTCVQRMGAKFRAGT